MNQFYTHEIVNFLNNVKNVREKDELIVFFTKPTEERINVLKTAFKKTKKKEEELRLRYLLSLVNRNVQIEGKVLSNNRSVSSL